MSSASTTNYRHDLGLRSCIALALEAVMRHLIFFQEARSTGKSIAAICGQF
jgi:hypothetical protein